MLSPDNSRLLARIRNKAVYYQDYEIVEEIDKIKNDEDITENILSYDKKKKTKQ